MDRTEQSAEINSQTWSINLQHRRHNYTMGKVQSLQQIVCDNWTATGKSIKLDHCLIPYTKLNSEWIEDLNLRPETIKLLKEKKGSNEVFDTGVQ